MKTMKVKLARGAMDFTPQNPYAKTGGVTYEVINIPDGESMRATLHAINNTLIMPWTTGNIIDRAKCGMGRVYR